MAEWRIHLRGDVSDLEALADDLADPSLSVRFDRHGFHLASSRFAGESDARVVKNIGDDLVARLNGVARTTLKSHVAIVNGGVARMRDDGKLDQWLFAEPAVFHARVGRASLLVNGLPAGPQGPSRPQRWLAAAEKDQGIARVLRLLGEDLDWVAVYKIVEIVMGACGGEQGVADRGWTSKAELKTLKHTANSVGALGDNARHGTEKTQAPKQPMTLDAARVLARGLAEQWLDSRA